jgi:hypothetical protein
LSSTSRCLRFRWAGFAFLAGVELPPFQAGHIPGYETGSARKPPSPRSYSRWDIFNGSPGSDIIKAGRRLRPRYRGSIPERRGVRGPVHRVTVADRYELSFHTSSIVLLDARDHADKREIPRRRKQRPLDASPEKVTPFAHTPRKGCQVSHRVKRMSGGQTLFRSGFWTALIQRYFVVGSRLARDVLERRRRSRVGPLIRTRRA